jgi:integrase
MSSSAPAATLRGYYHDVIRPQLIRQHASKSHLERHENVVARFEAFCGAEMPLDDITECLLKRFEAHLWDAVRTKQRYMELTAVLRRIIGFRLDEPPQNRRFRKCLPEPPHGSLRRFYERIYLPHRLAGCQDLTIREYRTVLYQLYEHYRRDILLSELSDDLASDHTQWLMSIGRKTATVNRIRAIWFAIWRYAFTLGHCEVPPRLGKLPADSAAPDAWDRDQLQRIIRACEIHHVKKIKGIPGDLWWGALLRVGYYTALRRRALFGLTWADIDLEAATITTPAAIMKTRQGQKYAIGPDAVDALWAIELPRRELVFPREIECFKKVYRDFDAILNAARVKGSTSNSPHFHKLRRSVATLVADAKGVHAAAELLGHSSDFITRRYIDRSQLSGLDFREVLTPLGE